MCTRKEVSEWPSILSLLRNKGGHFYNLTVRRPTKNSLLLQYGAPQKRLKKATRFPPKTGDIHHMCVFFWILFQKRGNLCSVEGNFLIGDEQTWENRRDKEKSKEKKKKKRERDFVFLSSFLFPFFLVYLIIHISLCISPKTKKSFKYHFFEINQRKLFFCFFFWGGRWEGSGGAHNPFSLFLSFSLKKKQMEKNELPGWSCQ